MPERPSRDQHIGLIEDQLKDGLGITTVAEACSDAVVEEHCHDGLQMEKVTTSKTSNNRRLQLLLDEKERIVDLRYIHEQQGRYRDIDNDGMDNAENKSGETLSSSSEEFDGTDGSDASGESKSQKDNPHYFDIDVEDNGNDSGIESVVDTIEHVARSFSGLNFLSDIGFGDLDHKEVDSIEKKVIQEYGMDCIKNYENELGDDDESSEEMSWEESAESLKQNNTATTAEILDDIINAEREGKEVVYDPNKKEKSSRRSLARSLKSLKIIRSHDTRSFPKTAKLDDGKEIKIHESEDALATRAAAAFASSMILNDIRQDEDDFIKDQGTISNPASEKPMSNCSYVATDVSDESDSPQRREKITIMVDTTDVHTESFVQGEDNEETILAWRSAASSSVNRECSGGSLNSTNKDREEERVNNIARDIKGLELGCEQQNLEIIHNSNGAFVRLSSMHKNSNYKSPPSIGSSAYYDNKEVVYDPTAFGEAVCRTWPSKTKNPCVNMKRPNSCCDLREITTTFRTRSDEDKFKLGKSRSDSISSQTWKIIEDGENLQTSEHDQSYPPTESEGVEMQLMLDCFNIAASKTNRVKKERNLPTSFVNKRRFLDPERLFCGLKPQKPGPAVSSKKKSKAVKNTKSNVLQSSSSEAELGSIRVESENQLREENVLSEKVKAHNISMGTVVTIPTDDEDGLSQFQIEVMDVSTVPSRDPVILALLQETRTPSMGNRKQSNSRKIRKSRSRESISDVQSKNSDNHAAVNVMDMTRISVTTGMQEIDSAYLPRDAVVPEANEPLIDYQVAIDSEAQSKPNYGGELVNLLHQISSYVDGIVETNKYSFAIPSTLPRDTLESNKDGNEADDERSNPRSNALYEANSSFSAISGATPSNKGILDAIYVPTSRTPDRKAEIQMKSQKDIANEQRKTDLLSLFDEPDLDTSPRALVDDELSDDSYAIVGSSIERSVTSPGSSHQQPEEPLEIWEENPVVYHMKSSPPQSKYSNRNALKRTTLKRTVQRHPSRSKTSTDDLSVLISKAKPIDDVDNDSVGSLPYRCVTNAKPKGSIKKSPVREESSQPSQLSRHDALSKKRIASQKENLPSQLLPAPLESTSRRSPPSYRERHRPPTPPKDFREQTAAARTGFGRMNKIVPASHKNGDSPDSQSKINTRSNGYVVDENGFLLDRAVALQQDVDESASSIEELEKRSEFSSFRSHESTEKPVMLGKEQPRRLNPTILVDNRLVTSGDRSRISTSSQEKSSSGGRLRNSFQAGMPELYSPPVQVMQARDRDVHS